MSSRCRSLSVTEGQQCQYVQTHTLSTDVLQTSARRCCQPKLSLGLVYTTVKPPAPSKARTTLAASGWLAGDGE